MFLKASVVINSEGFGGIGPDGNRYKPLISFTGNVISAKLAIPTKWLAIPFTTSIFNCFAILGLRISNSRSATFFPISA